MSTLHHILQLFPVILALIAAVLCTQSYATGRRRQDKTVMALGVLCALMLIVAQTSWWTTYLIQGNLLGTWFANSIWVIFNALTMIVFIILAYPRAKK